MMGVRGDWRRPAAAATWACAGFARAHHIGSEGALRRRRPRRQTHLSSTCRRPADGEGTRERRGIVASSECRLAISCPPALRRGAPTPATPACPLSLTMCHVCEASAWQRINVSLSLPHSVHALRPTSASAAPSRCARRAAFCSCAAATWVSGGEGGCPLRHRSSSAVEAGSVAHRRDGRQGSTPLAASPSPPPLASP